MSEFGHEMLEVMVVALAVVGIPLAAIVVYVQIASTKKILNAISRK
jgi:hypothetical protein